MRTDSFNFFLLRSKSRAEVKRIVKLEAVFVFFFAFNDVTTLDVLKMMASPWTFNGVTMHHNVSQTFINQPAYKQHYINPNKRLQLHIRYHQCLAHDERHVWTPHQRQLSSSTKRRCTKKRWIVFCSARLWLICLMIHKICSHPSLLINDECSERLHCAASFFSVNRGWMQAETRSLAKKVPSKLLTKAYSGESWSVASTWHMDGFIGGAAHSFEFLHRAWTIEAGWT